MVGSLSKDTNRIRGFNSICFLRTGLFPHSHITLCAQYKRYRLDSQCCNRILRFGFLERCTILRGQFCGRRRCTGHCVRLSSMRHSRYAADLRGSTVVLGSCTRQVRGYCFCCRKPQLVSEDHCTAMCDTCMPHVGCRGCTVHKSTRVLSSSARKHSLVLLVTTQTEDYPGMSSSALLLSWIFLLITDFKWFFVVVVIQNYWLSTPYGRNWIYLWSNETVPAWQIVILVLVFFVGIWIGFLFIFSHLSKSHSWILPVFAMGLGAPRWAQILWSNSNMGQYLPWTAGPVASAIAGRSLWLWLGVLDAVQGVGESELF